MGKGKLKGQEARRQRRVVPMAAFLVLAMTFPRFSARLRGQAPGAATKEAEVAGAARHPSVGSSRGGDMEYVIAANDVLDVDVVDVAQFSRDYRVGADGTITLPLLSSPVTAEGLTLNQLSEVISNRLSTAELVSHPHVVVSVKSSQAHAVAISGAVQTPQIYPIFGPTTLLDVLSQAGGLAADAGSTAVITRSGSAAGASWLAQGSGPVADAEGTIRVDLKKLLATGGPALNVPIYPGDKITVQRAGVVYVVGAVRRPGGFTLSSGHDRMTVLQAVAMSEGLKSTALQGKAMIIRRGQQFPDGREEIAVNLKHILAGQAPDPGLEASDILFVPDSTSRRALHRGAEAAIQIATGLVVWGRY
ncbi:MAG TPA: polysaccharide biosynthesis/export family protein [Terriglobia bacterium]|nr:polysaccharide biosynthesis/export family protein [Terriglobia bacterium]